ncbi:MAG: hypothetical protein HC828_10745, partial [Blastochloris sp.]|nr:hypothetical protein [Blastochloris sp.]
KLFGGGFALAMLFTYCWMRRVAKEQRAAQAFFETLSHLEPHDVVQANGGALLPAIPKSNPWFGAAERLRDADTVALQEVAAGERRLAGGKAKPAPPGDRGTADGGRFARSAA